eukprot:480405-Prymnesium_polylepis.1
MQMQSEMLVCASRPFVVELREQETHEMSLLCRASGLYVSARQRRCSALAVGLKWPRSASVHCAADVRSAALEKRLHDVAAVSSWYVPESQGAHSPSPPSCAIVPAAHAVCATLPVVAKKPGKVGMHCAALSRLVALENEPSLHDNGADAPRGQ